MFECGLGTAKMFLLFTCYLDVYIAVTFTEKFSIIETNNLQNFFFKSLMKSVMRLVAHLHLQ